MKRIFISGVLLFTGIFLSAQEYSLIWSDEFNGSGAPDSLKWDYETGYCRNNELQYYTKYTENTRQNNGYLEITVRQEKHEGFDFTSGSIVTKRIFDLKYGKIEGRFKMPVGKGLWSCFWTLGSNIDLVDWPASGEIDIFEHINNQPYIHGTAHWGNSKGNHIQSGGKSENLDVTQWHTYSVNWTPVSIKWYVDGKLFHRLNIRRDKKNRQMFHAPHFILINLPIGGSWPGPPDDTTILPATMYCDWVRVYELTNGK